LKRQVFYRVLLPFFYTVLITACEKDDQTGSFDDVSFYQSFPLQSDSLQFKDDTLFYDIDLDGQMDIFLSKYVYADSNNSARYGGEFYALDDSISFFYILENPMRLLAENDSVFNRQDAQWLDRVKYDGGGGRLEDLSKSNIFVPYIGFRWVRTHSYYGWIRFSSLDFREVALHKQPKSVSIVGRK